MKHTYLKLLLAMLVTGTTLASLTWKRHLLPLFAKPKTETVALAQKESGAIPQSTLSQIQHNLAEREYHISYDSLKQALQSPNRNQGLRAYYKPGQLTIVNRKDSAGHNFRLDLVNEGIYADGRKLYYPQMSAQTDQENNKLRIRHNGFIEEYINDTSGVRQNFIIQAAPAGTRNLQVRLDVKGGQVANAGKNALTLSPQAASGNADQLFYQDLKCWDANQIPLSAHLAYTNGRIQIDVDVENAAYPVTIDPLIVNGNPANADALLEANKAGAQMGYNVSSAGDINADGFSDVLVGAPLYDNGQVKEGAVFVYYGAATGLPVNSPQILESNKTGALLGWSVANAGDVNNDGFADIVAGAPLYTNGQYAEGVALVYYGAAGGLPAQPSRLLEINQAESRMGFAVAGAGDVNGDGFSDIIAGAYQYDNGQTNEGLTLIYFGSPGGIPAQAAWSAEGEQAEAWAGYSVRGAGDIDGDGYGDVLTGIPAYDNGHTNEGIVKVYHGVLAGIDPAKTKTIESNYNGALLGWSVAGAGDINGDGFGDVVLGAPLYTKGQYAEGVAFIHYGSGTGLAIQPALTLEANQAESRMGHSVACAGDVNGDGFADVIIGAYLYDNGQKDEGAIYVYQGRSNGLDPNPIATMEGEQIDAYAGFNVASAGDINGDGYSDIIAGSYAYDNGQIDEGAAFVWMGGARSIKETVVTHLEMNISGIQFGWSVAGVGDVNGDGFGDVIVSANNYDNGQAYEGAAFIFHGSNQGLATVPTTVLESNQGLASLGSVASAGDVNGDGFGDVAIGVPLYNNPTNNEGAVLVFYGSQQGLSTQVKTMLLGTQEDAKFGASVSSAGDVNKDGYCDIVVGEPEYDVAGPYFDEGRALIYYGSANGIGQNPTIINGNTDGVYMGQTVAGTIDVNGDGYSDILVGNPLYSNGQDYEGAVFVYYGSQGGITLLNPLVLQSNFPFAQMGAVTSAGDINGDGFGDIAVGALAYNNAQYSEGAVYVYYGSANGFGVPTIIESNVVNGYFGGVSSAGDLNGDGYGDLVVGSHGYTNGEANEGAFYLFVGSPNGIVTTYAKLIEGNQPSAFLGNSVAGAGDINADGYSDIIASAHQYDNGHTNEGRASVYYGNSSLGTRNNLRLYNTDLTTIIDHTQFPQNNFGAGLYAKSFLGRNKGKLVWETKPLAQGFSKGTNNAITNSTQFTGAQNAYTSLGANGVELKNLIDKQGPSTKVRVRVKYDPVLALTGQAYGPWRYLPAYLMGNSTAPVPEEVANGMSETIKRKATTADTEKWKASISVFPNPASDRLNIDVASSGEIQSTKILTSNGAMVYQQPGLGKSIDISKLPTGVYFLVITNQNGLHTTRKILINQ